MTWGAMKRKHIWLVAAVLGSMAGGMVVEAATTTVVHTIKTLTCTASYYGFSALDATGTLTCTGPFLRADVESQTAISGGAAVTTKSISAGNYTVDCSTRQLQYIPNTGAFTLTAPSSDGECALDIEVGASAGTITLSGFTPNSVNGTSPLTDTTNGNNYRCWVSRNHAHSSISCVALQ